MPASRSGNVCLLAFSLLFTACSEPRVAPPAQPDAAFCDAMHATPGGALGAQLAPLRDEMAAGTGVYVLERGNDALIARAWLSDAAERSIDIQYFIFSADNVGLIASDYLLRAAERGLRVRI